ncbi:MAG: rhomboid family intramembrane serine protease [bacterium]|nr:rhomboid family intramembrane serine protease [bacterium]
MSPVIERRPGFLNFPPVIKFLLITNIAVFALLNLVGGLTYEGEASLSTITMRYFALLPFDLGFLPWQLVSYQFMHTGFLHLLFNMFALWMFGVEIENLWGSRKFAVYYILCGIGAGIAHLVVAPMLSPILGPTIGASGSIMGVLLAFGMTFPTRPILMFPIFFPIPAKYFVMIYAAIDLFNGLMRSNSGVAHFAHLGGALAGFLLIKFGASLFDWIDRRAASRGERTFARTPEPQNVEYREVPRDRQAPVALHRIPSSEAPARFVIDGEGVSQEAIDEILDKISQHGYHSLSEKEKRILFEVSKQL